jgi:hypothetical protein
MRTNSSQNGEAGFWPSMTSCLPHSYDGGSMRDGPARVAPCSSRRLNSDHARRVRRSPDGQLRLAIAVEVSEIGTSPGSPQGL